MSEIHHEEILTQTDHRSLQDRMLRAEWNIGLHSDAIERLQLNAKGITDELAAIQKTLVQIKWFAMGVAAIYVADHFGLANVVKLFIGA